MKNKKIVRMAGMALLIAMVAVLQFVGGHLPSIGGFSISLVLIPIVLGASLYGPGAGALLGATFGLIVYYNCMIGTDIGGAMVYNANPLLCFFVVLGKGMLAGAASGLAYRLLKGKNKFVAVLCAAIICPIVNTGIFVASMFLFFIEVLSSWAGGGNVVGYVLTGLILANFVPELIINIIMAPASHRIIKVVKKNQ